MVKYLVSRLADPLLGLATGAFAYTLWENDPRNSAQRPPGRSLPELTQRWWNGEAPRAALLGGAPTTMRPDVQGSKGEGGKRDWSESQA